MRSDFCYAASKNLSSNQSYLVSVAYGQLEYLPSHDNNYNCCPIDNIVEIADGSDIRCSNFSLCKIIVNPENCSGEIIYKVNTNGNLLSKIEANYCQENTLFYTNGSKAEEKCRNFEAGVGPFILMLLGIAAGTLIMLSMVFSCDGSLFSVDKYCSDHRYVHKRYC